MEGKKHIVIFSHGFGVKKDDLGMLSDIAESLPNTETILFNYFHVDDDKKILTITPFSQQAEKLKEVYLKAKTDFPDAIIDIIAHSQGVFAPVLAGIEVRKAILLNSPFNLDIGRSLERYKTKPDCIINLEGMSRLYRSGGYLRMIPKEYWAERSALKKPAELFNEYSKKAEITIINGNQDAILGKADTYGLDANLKVINLDGDHSFNNNEDRLKLKEVIKEILWN